MGYSKKLVNTVVRLAKKDSVFVYFQLEGNENICFYSTLKASRSGDDRCDLLLTTTFELEKEFDQLLRRLQKKISMEVIRKEEVSDSPSAHIKYER